MADAQWYVVHTYTGYEKKVQTSIRQMIENQHIEDQILEVEVPEMTVEEIRNNVRREVKKKMFPGYVFVKMIMNDDTWYKIRNTRGVTGFVGPASKAVPLTPEEMARIGAYKEVVQLKFKEGDRVMVTSDPWKDTVGTIQSINKNKDAAVINIEMFGRETPVEINFSELKKI